MNVDTWVQVPGLGKQRLYLWFYNINLDPFVLKKKKMSVSPSMLYAESLAYSSTCMDVIPLTPTSSRV